MKPTLDGNGQIIPRTGYLISSLNCDGEDFAIACMRSNLKYGKNQKREDVKSQHYIISFDPRDAADNGLTVDRAQQLGKQFCKEHFPGHQALVCTHPIAKSPNILYTDTCKRNPAIYAAAQGTPSARRIFKEAPMHPLDEKFLQSKLPGRKLEIALERLFPPNIQQPPVPDSHTGGSPPTVSCQNREYTLPASWQKTYADYIRTRIYPALLLLAAQKDYGRMQRLLAAGWADGKLRLRLLQEEEIKDVQIRAMLLAAEWQPENRLFSHKDRKIPSDCGPAASYENDVSSALYPSQSLRSLPAGENPTNCVAGAFCWILRNLPSGSRLLALWGRRLGLEHPALRNVLASMRFQEVPGRRLPGTDGETIFYHTAQLEELAASGMGYPVYLHMVIHCLFFHILPPKGADRQLWDLACDAAASVLAEQMFPGQLSCGQNSGLVPSDGQQRLRKLLCVEEPFPFTSAAAIYHLLEAHPERADAFTGQFVLDDHSRWGEHPAAPPRSASLQPQPCRQHMLRLWVRAAGDSKGGSKPSSPRFGLMPGSRQDRMEKKEEGQYNFGRYLKRFSVTGEEMQLDTDSFDYIPYHYGMEHYGNLPFLEPLEYTETSKVEELVIAIDTSGSCSLRLVRRFLGETRKMLTEKEHFFSRMRVHIFQCDSILQDYQLIHSREEWSRYENRLSIAGRGGTNFTPVFERVNRMLETGHIKKLKGLLYFSDGDGVYPQEKPPYETAFIFPDFRFLDLKIPEWVVRICMEQRERP